MMLTSITVGFFDFCIIQEASLDLYAINFDRYLRYTELEKESDPEK